MIFVEICHAPGRWSMYEPPTAGWRYWALALYICGFSPGLGHVPWAVESDLDPRRFRRVCRGNEGTAGVLI
ncbi:hypothetical protein Mapa_005802 [Marchantia paleacea]|nr:hypothetical protein Mapa_005802 [Marchantia paleacea]